MKTAPCDSAMILKHARVRADLVAAAQNQVGRNVTQICLPFHMSTHVAAVSVFKDRFSFRAADRFPSDNC
jgi:hypothetical protein